MIRPSPVNSFSFMTDPRLADYQQHLNFLSSKLTTFGVIFGFKSRIWHLLRRSVAAWQ